MGTVTGDYEIEEFSHGVLASDYADADSQLFRPSVNRKKIHQFAVVYDRTADKSQHLNLPTEIKKIRHLPMR